VDWTAAVAEFVAMSLFGACAHAAISTHSELSSYPCAVFIGCGTAAHNTDITGHIYNRYRPSDAWRRDGWPCAKSRSDLSPRIALQICSRACMDAGRCADVRQHDHGARLGDRPHERRADQLCRDSGPVHCGRAPLAAGNPNPSTASYIPDRERCAASDGIGIGSLSFR
jgi:hypothetical protein